MLALDRITKRYGGLAALDAVSIQIPTGSTVALIGPSGCGKSTALRVIIGLVAADSGRVLVHGEPAAGGDLIALRRRFGYVIQEGGLFPHLTAAENVSLMARHTGMDRARIAERLGELTTLTRLDPTLLERYPNELSGGQRQRIGLMRALMLDPEFLLLDEPLGALDPLVRASLQEDLREIVRSLGKTVVLVTHDLPEAAFLADDLVLLNRGRVVARGDFAALAAHADPWARSFIEAQLGRVRPLVGIVSAGSSVSENGVGDGAGDGAGDRAEPGGGA